MMLQAFSSREIEPFPPREIPMNTNEPQEQVVLARVLNEMEAQPIVAALEAAKIPATMTGGFNRRFLSLKHPATSKFASSNAT